MDIDAAATRLFLDTEWADPLGSELVSLALVSEDGMHRFYAEREPLPATPTDFVQHVIYPLLDRGVAAMSDQAMTASLRAFLAALSAPVVVMADYPNDFALLHYVLAGFDLPEDLADACGPVCEVSACLVDRGAMSMTIEDYFAAHPEAAARRHHALVDAQALRLAWVVVTRQIEPPTWAQ